MVWHLEPLVSTQARNRTMNQEDIQKALEAISKGGITVAGDLVLEKKVEYEVNNVEKGGIGIQIVNGETIVPASEDEDSDEKDSKDDLIKCLMPIFYNNEEEAKAFAKLIQGAKPQQITSRVNQLVHERKISDISKRRPLWKVLHDFGIDIKSESNWNLQVK